LPKELAVCVCKENEQMLRDKITVRVLDLLADELKAFILSENLSARFELLRETDSSTAKTQFN
jgi:hypothetical protein